MRRDLSRISAFIVFFVTVLIVLAVDRYTKFLAVSVLSDGGSVALIPGVLDFMLVYNEGAAFGILQGARLYFIIVAAFASLGMIVYIAVIKRHSLLRVFALALICSGAVGNAIDRAASGKVVDFIQTLFIEFPLFNIADCAITIGVIGLIISLFLLDSTRSGKHMRQETALFSNKGSKLTAGQEGDIDMRGDQEDA